MITPVNDAVKAVFDLYNTMTDDLAAAHGTAQFEQRTVDDGWDQISERVVSADALLDGLIHEKATRSQHRHARATKSALTELHNALNERAEAQTSYLSLEATAKQTIDDGGSADLMGLDMARERASKAQQRMASDGSTLLYDLENLNEDLKA